MSGFAWLSAAISHPQGKRGVASSLACLACVIALAYCVSASHSIVLMSSLWISIFAFFSLLSALYSMSITHQPMQKFSYGLGRVPVLAVFSTTVLAQLFSVFLSKESFEHLLSPDHHGSHDAVETHEHEAEHISAWPFYLGSVAVSCSLFLSAYALKNQPFQHVLTSSTSSSLQEHAADISQAICWVIPGLSRLLLPRINAMVLLAFCSSSLLLLCEHFRHDFKWADPVCCVVLSIAVFSTMWPLSKYTGTILLQTAPGHLLNQIDRCISEASTIDGVLEIRSEHFWQLDFAQLVGSVDVRVRRDADEQHVLTMVTDKLSSVVHMLTVQIVKDAAGWQAYDSTGSMSRVYQNHGEEHGHSHDQGNHGHSHDGHGHGHSHGGATCNDDHSQQSPQYSLQYQVPTFAAPQKQGFEVHSSYDSQMQNSDGHSYERHGHSHDGVTYH